MRTIYGSGPSARNINLLGILLLMASCLVAAQNPQATTRSADLSSFAGIWKGEYKGQMFAVLNLHVENGRLTGTLSTAHTISLDDNGDIRAIEGEATRDKDTPVLETRLLGNSLTFQNRGADDDEMTTYKMQLSGKTAAGLEPQGSPESMKVKPFPLNKEISRAK